MKKKMKKTAMALACVGVMLLLEGCGLYRKYQSEVTVPRDNYSDLVADTTDNIARIGWREMFTDPCLQELIDSALKNNVDARTAMLSIEQAEISWKASRLAYLPTVAFAPTASAGYTQGLGNDWSYSLGMQASWQLDIFGAGITNTKRKAKAAREFAKDYDQSVRCRLISSVAQLYYEHLGLHRQYEIQQEVVALYEQTYESIQTLFEAGQYTSPAVHQTKAQLESLKAGLVDLEEAIDAVEHAICRLLDEPLHPIRHLSLESVSLPAQLSIGVPADILRNRPDVRVAERQIEMAYYDVRLAEGALYPSLTLSANGGWQHSAFSELVDPKAWVVQGVGSLVQPIFMGGMLRADLKIKKIDQQMAVLNFRKTVIDAGHEVCDAFHACHACDEKAPHLQEQVAALREAVLATQELMNNGTATYLEVLTALQELLQGELAETQNRTQKALEVVRLYSALGGGGSPTPDPSPKGEGSIMGK